MDQRLDSIGVDEIELELVLVAVAALKLAKNSQNRYNRDTSHKKLTDWGIL